MHMLVYFTSYIYFLLETRIVHSDQDFSKNSSWLHCTRTNRRAVGELLMMSITERTL